MELHEISNMRIASQGIEPGQNKSVKDLVSWMGALQAQDLAMAQWAIGTRINGSTIDEIEAAFNRGDIIRTHVMRPTWHFASADDIHWLLDLTAPRIKSSLQTRHRELGLSTELLLKSEAIIENVISEKGFAPREDITLKLNEAGIRTDGNRLSHILFSAELEKIVCSGPLKKNKQTYALLDERAANKKKFTRDEALAELAKRYFKSHGPATLKDFIWWSGLSTGDARKAIDFVKSDFISEVTNSETYWFCDSLSAFKKNKTSVFLLPAFDEFLISYTDRSASISNVNNKKAISNNGIFWPVIVESGQVIGIWKRRIKKDSVLIEAETFGSVNKNKKLLIEKAAYQYGHFLKKKAELEFSIYK